MNLRDKISTILVNNNMPTRQVAIGEIVELFDDYISRDELSKIITERMRAYADTPLGERKNAFDELADLRSLLKSNNNNDDETRKLV